MTGTDVPKVSVMVPVYNSGSHLEELVSSLLRQSLPPGEFEVVFADDGSTDQTPALLEELAAAHRHVRVLHLGRRAGRRRQPPGRRSPEPGGP